MADEIVFESPPVVYKSRQDVVKAFKAKGYRLPLSKVPEEPTGEFVLTEAKRMAVPYEEIAELFTLLEDCADHQINPNDLSERDVKSRELTRVSSPFALRVVYAPFYSKVKRVYEFRRLEIRQSRIRVAGMGVFAVDPISDGDYGFYKGQTKTRQTQNHAYSWELNNFSKSGRPVPGKPIAYIDATLPNPISNWARYVNCANYEFKNNITMEQRYYVCRYKALRDISSGEELFVDYGEAYRTASLEIDDSAYGVLPTCWNCGGEVVFMEGRTNYYAHSNYFECEACEEFMVWCDEGMHTIPLSDPHETNKEIATIVCTRCGLLPTDVEGEEEEDDDEEEDEEEDDGGEVSAGYEVSGDYGSDDSQGLPLEEGEEGEEDGEETEEWGDLPPIDADDSGTSTEEDPPQE